MYPHHFAGNLKRWLAAAGHPGIAAVRTCREVGWHLQPGGVMIDLSDGWRFVLQCVGTSPDGGNANRDPRFGPPTWPDGPWEDSEECRAARRRFEAEVGAYTGPKSRRPQAAPQVLLSVALDVVKGAGCDAVADVEIPDGRTVLVVTCVDGAKVFGLPAGYLAPGEVELAHPAHAIPAEWQKVPARVS